eukprot:750802-Hanusia_phi.AAC.1
MCSKLPPLGGVNLFFLVLSISLTPCQNKQCEESDGKSMLLQHGLLPAGQLPAPQFANTIRCLGILLRGFHSKLSTQQKSIVYTHLALSHFQLGQVDQAEQTLTQREKEGLELSTDDRMLKCAIAERRNDWEQAVRCYEDAVQENVPAALPLLAQAYSMLERYEDSARSYKKALDQAPQNTQVWMKYAVALRKLKNFKEAIKVYRKLMEEQGDIVSLLLGYARTLLEGGELEDAEEVFKKVIGRCGALPRGSKPRQQSSRGGRERCNPAEVCDAFLGMGKSLRERKRLKNARRWLEAGIAQCSPSPSPQPPPSPLSPNLSSAYLHENLGLVLVDMEKFREAREELRVALDMYKSNPPFDRHRAQLLGALGRAEKELGNFPAAGRIFREALELGSFPEGEQLLSNAFAAVVFRLRERCEWDEFEDLFLWMKSKLLPVQLQLEERSRRSRWWGNLSSLTPWEAQVYDVSPKVQLEVSRNHAGQVATYCPWLHPELLEGMWREQRPRVTIGYMSSDFGAHTVCQSMQTLLMSHSRSGFRTIAIMTTADDGSECRKRVEVAVEKVIHGVDPASGRSSSSHELATRISSAKIM